MRTTSRRALVLALTLLALALSAASAQAQLPVIYNFPTALAIGTALPNNPPPGANDFSCRPSAAHPRPVVLVHGTFENQNMNWRALSPLLKNNGYCVFTLNYGGYYPGPFRGIGDIPQSAQQLNAFVDSVRAATGAAEVDIVGHSQGGMMPRWYIKFLGGASEVNSLVGLSPSNHGTTLVGLGLLANLIPGARALLDAGCPACEQQIVGSAFLRQLNEGGDTVPGVTYTVIQTRNDEVVTPYTSAFLNGATNITVQNGCILDQVDHIAIPYDRRALGYVLNALDPARARTPPCTIVLPGIGG